MKVEKCPIQYTDELLNIRIIVNEEGYWAIDKAYNFVHNDKVIRSLSDSIFFEEDSWIHFYSFDERHFLLFDGHYRKGDNVWILDQKGEIIRSFSIGDGAIKIHVQEQKVIVAYSEILDSTEKK